MSLTPVDLEVRGALTRAIVKLGHAPFNRDLAEELKLPLAELEASLHRLHTEHALLLHPHTSVPWAVHPFALSPGSCWVDSAVGSWWANCMYCAFGIAAAVGVDTKIHTRLGGESEALKFNIVSNELVEQDFLFHLPIPPKHWWDNVIYTCGTFQPFRKEADIDDWCRRHALPKGAVIPLPTMWRFASDWYGPYLENHWRKRTSAEASALFAKHGFTSDFWALD